MDRGADEEDGQVTWETPVSPRQHTGQVYGDPKTNPRRSGFAKRIVPNLVRRAVRSRMRARGGQEEASVSWQVDVKKPAANGPARQETGSGDHPAKRTV